MYYLKFCILLRANPYPGFVASYILILHTATQSNTSHFPEYLEQEDVY